MIDLRRFISGEKAAATGRGTFGFAVVGLGRIADSFLRGIADSPIVRCTALVSGNPVKAQRIARDYSVPFTCGYSEMDALRARADVQAVYLALPVSMHEEFTAHAAMAGKHVLVEKPMASDAAQCCRMIADCRAAGVLLSVAYRCPFDPMHQQLRDWIAQGFLGRVERIESQFGFPLDADDWRFDAALAGGGSAYDVGVYPLNAARYLLGTEPVITAASATRNAAGMETSIAWTMQFPGGAEAECKSSYVEKLPGTLRVRGTAGDITLDPAFAHREPIRMRGQITDPKTRRRIRVDTAAPKSTPSHFRLEAEHLATCALTGSPLITSGQDALRDMQLIGRMYAMAGIRPEEERTDDAVE